MGDDNRKGFFNDAPNHGEQNYYDRLPPRGVPLTIFDSASAGPSPSVIVRPSESEHERFLFAQSLADAFSASGISATVQGGYSQAAPPFAGISICAAPNESAREMARRVMDALSRNNLTATMGPEMGWGDDNRILLLIGANG